MNCCICKKDCKSSRNNTATLFIRVDLNGYLCDDCYSKVSLKQDRLIVLSRISDKIKLDEYINTLIENNKG